jgi:hypothetical protein
MLFQRFPRVALTEVGTGADSFELASFHSPANRPKLCAIRVITGSVTGHLRCIYPDSTVIQTGDRCIKTEAAQLVLFNVPTVRAKPSAQENESLTAPD